MQERPLYLINAFWGATYRRWFADFFLRSLLAPGNVAELAARPGSKLLLATTAEDWSALQAHPALLALRAHMEIVFQPIATLDDRRGVAFETTTYNHVGAAYAGLLDRAWRDQAIGIMFSPDLMISDGLVGAVLRRMEQGANLVFIPAWRSDETKLMAGLAREGLLAHEADVPIALPPRRLAAVMASCIHKLESLRFWRNDTFHEVPSYSFWPVEGNGWVMFGMSGVPCVDYSQVVAHDVSRLASVSLDAYPALFQLAVPNIQVIADTDEGSIASWTPTAAEDWVDYKPRARLRIPGLRDFARCAILRAYAQHVFFWGMNRANLAVYNQPLRLHGGDIDAAWLAVERRARRLVARAVGDMYPPGAFGDDLDVPVGKPWHPWWLAIRAGAFVFAFEQVAKRNLQLPFRIVAMMLRALGGSRDDRERLLRRLRFVRRQGPA